MSRAVRCSECRDAELAYCAHNGVLVVHLAGVPLRILSRDEEHARLTADRISLALRGKPMRRRPRTMSDSEVSA